MVYLPRFPEVPDLFLWVVGSQVFWSFFYILGGWWDISALVLHVSGHAPLNCLNLNLALLHIPRIPSSWESLSILVQYFSLSSLAIFLPLRAGLDFFFPLFREVQNPSMSLGPFLWTLNGFGPPPFLLKARMFSRFQSFVLFWALVQHCDFLDLNTFSFFFFFCVAPFQAMLRPK